MLETVQQRELGYSLPVHWAWVLVAGLAMTWLVFHVYLRERGPGSKKTRWLLSLLRSLTCLLVLLASMNWHVVNKRFRKPELMLIFDQSQSLQHLDGLEDSPGILENLARRKWDRPNRLNILKAELLERSALLEQLGKQFRLTAYGVGETVRPLPFSKPSGLVDQLEAEAGQSRIDQLTSRLIRQSAGNPPEAILLFSDGLDSGNPKFQSSIRAAQAIGVPIHPVGLGSMTPARRMSRSWPIACELRGRSMWRCSRC